MATKNSLIISVFLIVFSLIGYSQINRVEDSVLNIIHSTKQDSIKISCYSYLALKLEESASDKSLMYGQKVLELSVKNNDKKGIAQAHNLLGRTYSYTNKYDKAQKHLFRSLKLFKELSNKERIAESYNNLGILFYYQNRYQESIKYLRLSAGYYIELQDTSGFINTYNNIGLITYYIGNNAEALYTFDTALLLAEQIKDNHSIINLLVNRGIVYDRIGNKKLAIDDYYRGLEICELTHSNTGKSSCLNNIADSYLSANEYDKALEFYNKSLELDKQSHDRIGEVISLNNIGDVYRREQKYEQAIETLKIANNIAVKIEDTRGQARALHVIGRIFFAQNKHSLALDYYKQSLNIRKAIGLQSEMAECLYDMAEIYYQDKKYQEAISSLLTAIDYKLAIDGRENLDEYYFLLSRIYAKKKQYKKAYINHVKYKELSDSLYSSETAQEITKVQMEYDYNREKEIIDIKHQKENELYEHEIKSQKILRNFLIGGLFIVLLLLSQIYRLYITKSGIVKELQKKNTIIVSQKKEIEKIVDELHIANDTKDKFFSIIAHDLKGPFNVIIGFSDLLRNHYLEFDESTKQEFIENVNESAKRTFDLLVNLLEWARNQTGAIEFAPTFQSVNEIVETNINLMILQAKKKNITLQFVKPKEDIEVYADSYLANSVLRNLISNSIKFTQDGGVLVKTEIINNFCHIIVQDTGVGIDDEYIQDLFKIDKTVSTKGTAGETGTGLGLMLCKDFAEKNGGSISVESKKGMGSKFVFTLPIA